MDKQEYLDLIESIKKHDKLYYDKCKPIISDKEYDHLVKDLEKIEKKHPEWIIKSSPTRKVSVEKRTKGFSQASHISPMLSLSNTYSKEEIEEFIQRVYKLLEKENVGFSCELKMDGTAISLRYEKGNLVKAITRGNGKKGDVVTENIRTIKSIPERLQGRDIPDLLEVRGEVYLLLKDFEKMNEKNQKEGKALFANPRNAAAGSLKLLDAKEVEKRNLQILCYGIAEDSLNSISTQGQIHEFLKGHGIPACHESHFAVGKNAQEIFTFIQKQEKLRTTLPFEIDGIVIKVNQIGDHQKMGTTGKSPRWATAYKFAAEKAETIIKDISVQVGRTGVLTPVAELEPALLAGSTISRATLHNEEEVQRKDIRIGDTVIIEKGGDVIPKVVEVITKKRPKESKPWKMPNKCPICQSTVQKKEGEVATRCPNTKECGGQNHRRLCFFTSKAAMDIENLGPKIVAKFIDAGILQQFSDIYKLKAEDLMQLEGFKETSIKNLLESIEKSKTPALARFIFALGIPHVGIETAELVANHYGTLEEAKKANKEELIEIEGIGETVATSIEEYFAHPLHLKQIDELLDLGVKPKPAEKIKNTSHAFFGKTFVLTGSLSSYTRSVATRLIKERGGKTSSSVSAKTDFILAGEDPGSKYDKAKKLGIKIFSEEAFTKVL